MKKRYIVSIFLLMIFAMFAPESVKACAYYDQYGDHFWADAEYKLCDSKYHYEIYICDECGQKSEPEKKTHDYEIPDKSATLYQKGYYVCWECKDKIAFDWSYAPSYSYYKEQPESVPSKIYYRTYYNSCSYDIKYHSPVYKTSKKLTVYLESPSKGCVLKVKIGDNTYRKEITSTSKKVTVKIKKSAYGKKISMKLYYKGQLVGKDRCCYYYHINKLHHSCLYDHVLYGDHIKKGMTTKQLKYSKFWGSYKSKDKKSNGRTYWRYKDGSYVYFVKGKVAGWHKAD